MRPRSIPSRPPARPSRHAHQVTTKSGDATAERGGAEKSGGFGLIHARICSPVTPKPELPAGACGLATALDLHEGQADLGQCVAQHGVASPRRSPRRRPGRPWRRWPGRPRPGPGAGCDRWMAPSSNRPMAWLATTWAAGTSASRRRASSSSACSSASPRRRRDRSSARRSSSSGPSVGSAGRLGPVGGTDARRPVSTSCSPALTYRAAQPRKWGPRRVVSIRPAGPHPATAGASGSMCRAGSLA